MRPPSMSRRTGPPTGQVKRPRVTIFPSTERAGENVRGEVVESGSDGVPVETFIPEPDPDVPGAWVGDLSDPCPPGDYTGQGHGGREEPSPAEGTASFAVEPLSVEMLRTSGDAALLGRLAAASGGGLVGPEEVENLAGMIDLEDDTVVSTSVRKIRGKVMVLRRDHPRIHRRMAASKDLRPGLEVAHPIMLDIAAPGSNLLPGRQGGG